MRKRRNSNGSGDAPAKKYQKRSYESDDNDGASIVVCEIADNKRVTVRSFNGKVVIDLRETYVNNDGNKCPLKKGISLTVDQWNILREHLDDDEVVDWNN